MHFKRLKFLQKQYPAGVQKIVFTALWILGTAVGCAICTTVPGHLLSLMRTSFSASVSIVRLFFTAILPLLFPYISIQRGLYGILLPLVFVKAFLFGFSYACVSLVFGSAGWLMCMLCLFADIGSLVIFLWFLFNYTHWEAPKRRYMYWICFSLLSAIVLIMYFLVSPFVVSLLNF